MLLQEFQPVHQTKIYKKVLRL